MKRLQVFDPPMCCPGGVCGPTVDLKLPQFAADIDWLKSCGVDVERHNLAQEPRAFVEHELVRTALAQQGEACLPLILVDGAVAFQGAYPSRDELAACVLPGSAHGDPLQSRSMDALKIASCCPPGETGSSGKCC